MRPFFVLHAMPNFLVASNEYLRQQLNFTIQTIKTTCSLRLFANTFTPGPGSLLVDFMEPVFTGYARQGCSTMFPLAIKVQDGAYESRSAVLTFDSLQARTVLIYGWFIASASQVFCSFRFADGFPLNSLNPLQFRIALADTSFPPS